MRKSFWKCQGNEEMRKIWCTEAQRTHQLRMDDLPRQEEESQSTVHQLTTRNFGTGRESEFSDRFQGFP